jgi:alpha-ketoglutarate-dependent taurine dioxygenase
MALRVEPVDATLGAFIHNVKVTTADDATFAEIYATWLKHALIIIPGQFLSREEQISFAKRFGPLEFEMARTSNVKPDGTFLTTEDDKDHLSVIEATHAWHSDSTYKPIHAKGAVFSAEVVPPGGSQTGFADMRAAYDALDPAMRARVETLNARHSFYQSQAKHGRALSADAAAELQKIGDNTFTGKDATDAPLRPMVKIHPETGRKSLLLGYHIVGIDGLSETESDALVKELMTFACQPPRTYHHPWKEGDVLVWDNRCLLHRSKPWDLTLPRVMWHTRLAGDPVTEAALA